MFIKETHQLWSKNWEKHHNVIWHANEKCQYMRKEQWDCILLMSINVALYSRILVLYLEIPYKYKHMRWGRGGGKIYIAELGIILFLLVIYCFNIASFQSSVDRILVQHMVTHLNPKPCIEPSQAKTAFCNHSPWAQQLYCYQSEPPLWGVGTAFLKCRAWDTYIVFAKLKTADKHSPQTLKTNHTEALQCQDSTVQFIASSSLTGPAPARCSPQSQVLTRLRAHMHPYKPTALIHA